MTIEEVLAEFGVTEADFAAGLERTLHAAPRPASATLTVEQRRVLAEGGLPLAERTGGEQPDADNRRAARAFALRQTANLAAQVRDSLTVGVVARAHGVDESLVRRRIRDRALYAFRLDRVWRLPSWQFDGAGQPLPGLRSVLAALPAGLHPLTIAGFMTTPDGDYGLGDHGAARDWLIRGGDPAVVAEKAATLDIW